MELTRLIRVVAIALCAAAKARVARAELTDTFPPTINQDALDNYLKSAQRTPVMLTYPVMFLFSAGAITDFRTVAIQLQEDAKVGAAHAQCEFALVQSDAEFDGDMSSLEPVLSYHRNGETVKYQGPINVGYILAWLSSQRVCDMNLIEPDHINEFVRKCPPGHAFVFTLFKNAEGHEPLTEMVRSILVEEDIAIPVFYLTDGEVTANIYRTHSIIRETVPKMPNIFVYRNMRLVYSYEIYNGDTDDRKAVRDFLLEELIPPVHGSDSYMLPKFLTMNKTIVYVYTQTPRLSIYLPNKWMRTVARKHSDKFVFLHSKGSELVENKMNAILAIDEYENSAVRAFVVDLKTMEFYKYRPVNMVDGKLDGEVGRAHAQSVEKFVEDLEQGKLNHYVKSELPVPEYIDRGPVKTMVGEDFHRRVIETREDVLMLFLSSWCGHCHHAKRVFRDLGRRLKGSRGPVLATFDAYNNEIEDMEIAKFPTIALYQSGHKDAPLFFDGEPTVPALAAFLEKNCKHNRVNAENIVQKHVSKEAVFEFHTEL